VAFSENLNFKEVTKNPASADWGILNSFASLYKKENIQAKEN
jgi:hypothetical protein